MVEIGWICGVLGESIGKKCFLKWSKKTAIANKYFSKTENLESQQLLHYSESGELSNETKTGEIKWKIEKKQLVKRNNDRTYDIPPIMGLN